MLPKSDHARVVALRELYLEAISLAHETVIGIDALLTAQDGITPDGFAESSRNLLQIAQKIAAIHDAEER